MSTHPKRARVPQKKKQQRRNTMLLKQVLWRCCKTLDHYAPDQDMRNTLEAAGVDVAELVNIRRNGAHRILWRFHGGPVRGGGLLRFGV